MTLDSNPDRSFHSNCNDLYKHTSAAVTPLLKIPRWLSLPQNKSNSLQWRGWPKITSLIHLHFLIPLSRHATPQTLHAHSVLYLISPPLDCHTAHFLNSNVISSEGLLWSHTQSKAIPLTPPNSPYPAIFFLETYHSWTRHDIGIAPLIVCLLHYNLCSRTAGTWPFSPQYASF